MENKLYHCETAKPGGGDYSFCCFQMWKKCGVLYIGLLSTRSPTSDAEPFLGGEGDTHSRQSDGQSRVELTPAPDPALTQLARGLQAAPVLPQSDTFICLFSIILPAAKIGLFPHMTDIKNKCFTPLKTQYMQLILEKFCAGLSFSKWNWPFGT